MFSTRTLFSTSPAAPVTNTRSDLFEKHLDCYNFQAFHTDEHQQFVHDYYRDHQAHLNTETKLVLSSHLSDGRADADVLKTMTLRSPVYWGRDCDEMIKWDKVEQHFGYGKADTQLDPELVSNTRYAIVGPMRVMAHGDQPERNGNAIHLWAVNLESAHTADYKTLIDANKTPDGFNYTAIEKAYFRRHYEVLELIMRSALTSLKPGQMAHVFSALLGAGCFLRAVSTDLRERLLNVQFRALTAILATYSNVRFTLRIFSPEEFSPELVVNYTRLTKIFPQFTVGVGRTEGNVLVGIPTPDDKVATFVVNAGDPRSFIGNGMSKDPTVEGFLVANARGFNNQYRNTSYLHNVRFIPSLMDPTNWIRGD